MFCCIRAYFLPYQLPSRRLLWWSYSPRVQLILPESLELPSTLLLLAGLRDFCYLEVLLSICIQSGRPQRPACCPNGHGQFLRFVTQHVRVFVAFGLLEDLTSYNCCSLTVGVRCVGGAKKGLIGHSIPFTAFNPTIRTKSAYRRPPVLALSGVCAHCAIWATLNTMPILLYS
jgi:hypothetical protein